MSKLEQIKGVLLNNSNVSSFTVNELNENRYELYFVLNKVETARKVNVTTYNITIFHNYGNAVGSYSYSLNDAFTNKELLSSVEEALTRCSYAQNKPFELPEPELDYLKIESNISEYPLDVVATNVSKAIFKADTFKDGWINSTEIFVSRNNYHFINSKGADVAYSDYRLFIELIPTYKGRQEEVELYLSYSTNDIDYDEITEMVNDKLLQAKERGEATSIPNDLTKINVLLKNEAVTNIMKYFASELTYQSQLRHVSKLNIGSVIDCDISLSMEPVIKGSPYSMIIDKYGKTLRPILLIDNKKVVNFHGDYVEGKYFGESNPTGTISNFKVKANSPIEYKELVKEPYLEILGFSAFQLDSFSGFYGGEVRLALYFDGKKLTPVSGFSISGNLFDDFKNMKFSKEEGRHSVYSGPKYICVPMTIAK